MFRLLPCDVILDVLVCYVGVDLPGLALLDMAVTNHISRSDWLSVLTAMMPLPQEFPRPRHWGMGNYLQWLASRKVAVACLHVRLADIDGAVKVYEGFLSSTGVPGVRSIVFEGNPDGRDNNTTALPLAAFLRLFPDLEAISCQEWHHLEGIHLAQFRAQRPLRSLKLSTKCWKLSSCAIVEAITLCCAEDMKEFSCTASDEVMLALCARCQSLESIALSVDSMDTLDLIQTLCSNNSKQLRHVSLTLYLEDMADPMILHELILSIVQPCSRLECVELDYRKPVVLFPAKLINHFIDVLPLLKKVVINGSTFEFNRHQSTKVISSCDISWEACAESPIRTPCEGFVTIRAFQMGPYAASYADNAVMMLWADKLGEDLQVFSVRGGEEGFEHCAKQLVLFVAQRCKNLSTVQICNVVMHDDDVCELALRCPHIKSIKLDDVGQVSDHGMIQFLGHCKCLESISISNPRVTDETLKVLANKFPSLANLELRETAITKLCLFELIWRRKLTVKVLLCRDIDWIKKKLLKERFWPLPKVLTVNGRELVENKTPSWLHRQPSEGFEDDDVSVESNDDTVSESE